MALIRISKLNPGLLSFAIVTYYLWLAALISVAVFLYPGLEDYLPVAGRDARDITEIGADDVIVDSALRDARSVGRYAIAMTLIAYLACAVVTMLPVTWVYMATHRETGFKRNFVVSLLVFPIVATSMVLLIQDSLALAFGLAALVAAIRFRIRLRDTLDGIYVFSAIAVGLSAGVGYVGVGAVTALFFCLVIIVLWKIDFAGGGEREEIRQ